MVTNSGILFSLGIKVSHFIPGCISTYYQYFIIQLNYRAIFDATLSWLHKVQHFDAPLADQQGGMIFFLFDHLMENAQIYRKRPVILAFGPFQGHKAEKGQTRPKKKYGSKCLELSNSARNAKIAKNCQKVPKASIILNLAFKGLKLKI